MIHKYFGKLVQQNHLLGTRSAVAIALPTPEVDSVVLTLVRPGSRARGSVGLRRWPVDADLDTRVVGAIAAGELDGWAGGAVAVAGNLDLGTADANRRCG
jgi:hypothetical protein